MKSLNSVRLNYLAIFILSIFVSVNANAQADSFVGKLKSYDVGATSNMQALLDVFGCYPTDEQVASVSNGEVQQYVKNTLYDGGVSSNSPIIITRRLCNSSGMPPSIMASFATDSLVPLSAKMVSPSGIEYPLARFDYRGGYAYTVHVNSYANGITPLDRLEVGDWRLVISSPKGRANFYKFYVGVHSNW